MAPKSIRVEIPSSGYRRCMPFNRYHIEKVEDFLVITFGFVGPSSILLDHYCCAISRFELDQQKKSVMDYLGKTGTIGSLPPPVWQANVMPGRVELFSNIGLCGTQDFGEIALNNIVGKSMIEVGASGVIKMDPVAILRSSMSIQQHWIMDLYK